LPADPATNRFRGDPGESTTISATPGHGGAMTVTVRSMTGERSELLETVTSASAEVSHQCPSSVPDDSSPVEPVVTAALTGLVNWDSVATANLPAGVSADDAQPLTTTANDTVNTSAAKRPRHEVLTCAPRIYSADSAEHSPRRHR
jgi:hypothetical protein